jgi:hypothetical protein
MLQATLRRLSFKVATFLLCGLHGGKMEIYKQGCSKYWIADFRVNGRRIRRSTKLTKRSAALEAAVLILREAQSGPVARPSR